VAHILCLKILYPTQVYLIRGNHEFPSMNGNLEQYHRFVFLDECIHYYEGDEVKGRNLWNLINDCFEYLPIAGTVDSKIFFTHGGIPRHLNHTNDIFTDIRNIPRPLNDKYVYSDPTHLALDLLWSDPTSKDQEDEVNSGDGFGPNLIRGNDTSSFGNKAMDIFQNKTGCALLVRAHQPPNLGLSLKKKGKSNHSIFIISLLWDVQLCSSGIY